MITHLIDSHLRCPRCKKRMVLDVGQDDHSGAGDMRATHRCLECPYTEIDKNWSAPLGTDRPRTTLAARLRQQRLGEGVEIPLVYTPGFPEAQL